MKIKEKLNGDKIYFMSDLHYGHENVIKFDKRPFDSVGDMNKYLEKELELLRPGDILFDLGDLFWNCGSDTIKKVLDKVKCTRFFKVLGNHDKRNLFKNNPRFEAIDDILDINVTYNEDIFPITLCHYPMVSWYKKPYGSFQLHGHCHGNIDQYNNESNDLRVDVSCFGELAKSVGSILIPFEKILEHFTKKTKGMDFKTYVQSNCKEL